MSLEEVELGDTGEQVVKIVDDCLGAWDDVWPASALSHDVDERDEQVVMLGGRIGNVVGMRGV